MKNLKNQKGITLVALVVTIIVLLILAGVSLRLVAGNEGILGRSESAVNKSNLASAQEKVDLGIANAKLAYLENQYYDKTNATANGFAKYLTSNENLPDDVKKDLEGANITEDATNNLTIVEVQGTYKAIDSNGKISKDWSTTQPTEVEE